MQKSFAWFWQSVSSPGLFSQRITGTHNAQISPHPPTSLHGPSPTILTTLWKACSRASSSGASSLLVLSTCPIQSSVPAWAQCQGGYGRASRGNWCSGCVCVGLWQCTSLGFVKGGWCKAPDHVTFFIRLHAILSALPASYLLHIYLDLLMSTWIMAGNVKMRIGPWRSRLVLPT